VAMRSRLRARVVRVRMGKDWIGVNKGQKVKRPIRCERYHSGMETG